MSPTYHWHMKHMPKIQNHLHHDVTENTYSRVGTYTRKRNLGLKKKITWVKSHLFWGNSTDYDDTNLLYLNATWQGRSRFLPTSFDAASQNKSLKVVDDLCNFEMSTKVKMTTYPHCISSLERLFFKR